MKAIIDEWGYARHLECLYRVRLVSYAASARLRRLGLRPRAIFNGAHDVRPGVLRVIGLADDA